MPAANLQISKRATALTRRLHLRLGSHMTSMPFMEQVVIALLESNVVIRFDWSTKPAASTGLRLVETDMQSVLSLTEADPRIDSTRTFVGGKSKSKSLWSLHVGNSNLAPHTLTHRQKP